MARQILRGTFPVSCYSEFLSQSWTKSDKEIRAPGIHLMTKRFNDVSFVRNHDAEVKLAFESKKLQE